MRWHDSLSLSIALVIGLLLQPGFLEAQHFESAHQDWAVFTHTAEGTKQCYIASVPTKQTGNYKKRGAPYILVNHTGKNKGEINVSSGYPYKENAVTLTIGKQSFTLFTQEEHAWAKTEADDTSMINAMKKGSSMVVAGKSKVGSQSKDSYSLKGFSKALEQMQTLCP